MAEKFKDEEEIIDLTDLMEEGDLAKKLKKAELPFPDKPRVREPESFDLGKEISREDEISLEGLEADTKPAALQEVVLPEEKPAEAVETVDVGLVTAKPETTKPDIGADFESALKESISSSEAQGPALEEIPASQEKAIVEEPSAQKEAKAMDAVQPVEKVSADFDIFFKETVQEAKVEDKITPVEEKVEIDREPSWEEEKLQEAKIEVGKETKAAGAPELIVWPPVHEEGIAPKEETMEAILQEASASLREDIPAMIEGIIKPVMGELVREVIKATRDILPGIVEKVIREEIEKLKKLD
jgi:hypothetical protein